MQWIALYFPPFAQPSTPEHDALHGMALWACRFTPHIVLKENGLLLDITGSLVLFGGLKALLQTLRADLKQMNCGVHIASAPTATAAWWLARAAPNRVLLQTEALPQALSPLPLAVLDCADKQRLLFAQLGLRNIGDLAQLPRAGVTKRFGRVLDQLDQALGVQAEGHSFFEPPESFRVRVEPPAEIEQAEALLFVAKRLVIQLGSFLAARLAAIQAFELQLEHRDAPMTTLRIGLMEPSRDTDHLLHLLRERLTRLALPQPVRAIALHAPELSAWAGKNHSLLQDDTTQAEEWPRLVEQLRARLGAQNVRSIQLQAEHRPEAAFVFAAPDTPSPTLDFPLRPLWLLPEPRALREHEERPHYQGPLKLIAGPERIRSGWWDGRPISRDYFIAQTAAQSLLWIYREAGRGWFLHGYFA
jgi:Nucleotidyltransferase/DNA polymerase involved in DNA repair